MARSVVVRSSRAFRAPVERAFAEVMAIDLATIFRRRFGPLPPISRVEDQQGAWATTGQTRTVWLGDGSQVRERLTEVAAPHRFTYELIELTGPMRFLVAGVDGRWDFDPRLGHDGSTVTWSWVLRPRSAAAVPGLLVLSAFWRGYARRALAELDPVLGAAAA